MEKKHDIDLKGFRDIKADKGLTERTVNKIMSANNPGSDENKQMNTNSGLYNKKVDFRRFVSLAASFILVVGAITIYSLNPNKPQGDRTPGSNVSENTETPVGDADKSAGQNNADSDTTPHNKGDSKGLEVPAIQLPENTRGIAMDMIGLFVYNGKIYTQTGTSIDPENGKKLLGEKLGVTKGTIDEWSKQDAYAVEFASNIGEMDVYTAKGYDKDFRLMTYVVFDGGAYAQFYECLNGITIYSGQDVFGKLNIEGNIVKASYRSYEDWNNSIENYHPIEDTELYNSFAIELNNTVPYPPDSTEINEYRNNGGYRELKLELKDGSVVDLALFKNGFIRYGYSDFLMKMEHEVFQRLWEKMTL
jgi:hypothetical protein